MTTTKEKTNVYFVDNDTGYGFLKSIINGTYAKIPTVLQTVNDTNGYQYNESEKNFDNLSIDQKEDYVKNILKRQYVSISSDLGVLSNLNKKYLIGQNALDNSGDNGSIRSMDYNDPIGKAGQELTYAFILSAIAYKAFADQFEQDPEDFDFDKPINVKVQSMTTALPISESTNDETVNAFKNNYLNKKHNHTVTIWNFKGHHVTVNIKFENVAVTREGLIAQLALLNADKVFPEMLQHIQKQLDSDYGKGKYDANKLLKNENVLLIDIGAGTTDMVQLIKGQPQSSFMVSIKSGYDSVLDKVGAEEGITDSHSVSDLIKDAESTDEEYALDLKDSATRTPADLATAIIPDSTSQMRGNQQKRIQSIVVFGGGANGFRENRGRDKTDDVDLKKELQSKAKNMGRIKTDTSTGKKVVQGIPVIWIGQDNPNEANNLNLMGLELQNQLIRSQA